MKLTKDRKYQLPQKFSSYKTLLMTLSLALALDVGVAASGLVHAVHGQEGTASGYHPDATIADIMESIVMPSADTLWNAVMIYSTLDGMVEEKPETDADWARLRWSAINLAEATNLLLIPGRQVDNPNLNAESPDYELGPAQIQALIAENPQAWAARALVLHETALQTIRIIDAHDADGLSDIGGAIDEACEACHQQFWYPQQ